MIKMTRKDVCARVCVSRNSPAGDSVDVTRGDDDVVSITVVVNSHARGIQVWLVCVRMYFSYVYLCV